MAENKITHESVINSVMAKHDEMNGSDFPLHLFPKRFQDIARESSTSLGYPLDFIAGSMMFAAAVAIGATFNIKVKEGWTESLIFYLAIVGKAGTNKSHPMSFAMSPLFDFDAVQNRLYKEQYAEYLQMLSMNKKERDEQGGAEPLHPPKLTKFVVSDVTPEGLAYIHEQNKRGICLYADELKSWINNFNRYSKGSEEQFWLSNFSGKPIIIDRRSAEASISVRRSLISVIGSIQLLQLRDLAKGDKGCNGFLDRILFLIPRRLQKEYWNTEEVSPLISSQWSAIITELISIECPMDENGNPTPTTLAYSSDTKARLYEWQRQNTDLCNGEFDERLVGIYSKLEIYVSRFSLLMQLIRWVYRDAGREAIDIKSLEAAIALTEYFRGTAQKVLDFIYGSEFDKLNEQQKTLVSALPESFTTAEGMVIAMRCGVPERTFKRFIMTSPLFRKEKHGYFTKVM
ncbi:MAG: DUF3987 domain-containing protein [Rikenellaceae bacterium]